MQATSTEPNVQGIQNYEETFFSKAFYDDKYTSTDYMAFYPTTTVNNFENIEFCLPSNKSGSIYQLHECVISVHVTLTKQDGTKLDAGSQTAIINNCLHSLFSDVRQVMFNGVAINPNSRHYGLKTYMTYVTGISKLMKFSNMATEGFFVDTGKLIESASSTGFRSRRKLFRNEADTDYINTQVPLLGRLLLDTSNNTCGIPPNIEVRLTLSQAPSDFVIQSFDGTSMPGVPTTAPNYKVTIKKCVLHVPISTLSPTVYARFLTKISDQPVNLFFRRYVANVFPIPSQATMYSTDNLFPRSETPSRLFLAFIETEKLMGTQTSTPFNFARTWKTKATSTVRIRRPQESAATSSSSLSNMLRTSAPPQTEFVDQEVTVENEVFIKRVYVTINGKEISSLGSLPATKEHDMENFYKFNMYIGSNPSTGFSCGIDYSNDWLQGYFMPVFDLTSTGEGYEMLLSSSVRLGIVRFHVEFSSSLNTNLSLFVMAEQSSLITISKEGKVSLSYPN